MPELPQIAAEGGIQTAGFPKPPIAPGEGVEGLHQASEATEGMATELAVKLNEIRRTTQFNMAESDYRQQADDISYKVLRDPKTRSDPDAARTAVATQLEPVQAQIRANYPAADWDGMLTRNMRIWGDSRTRVVGHAAIDNLEQDTKDEIKAQTPRAIADALTLSDPKDRQAAVSNHLQLIKTAETGGLMTKGEADLERATFQFQLQKGQFMQQSRANPAQTLLLDGAHPPEGVLPEWVDEAKKLSIDQLDSTKRLAEADASQRVGALWTQAMTSGSEADWEKYRAGGGSEEIYEAHTGRQFIRPSVDPGLRDSYIAKLQNSRSEDTPFIVDEAEQAYRNGALGSKDLAQVTSEAMRVKSFNNTADKKAEIQWRDDVLSEYVPKGTDPLTKMFSGMTPKVNMTALDAAMNDAWTRSKGDPVKAKKMVDDKFKEYMIHGDAATKGSVDRLVP